VKTRNWNMATQSTHDVLHANIVGTQGDIA
jgi:hypothetical protein